MAKICIYGAASNRISQEYIDAVYKLGKAIAKSGNSLTFGAGSTGLMGAAARGVRDAGGRTFGVAPEGMEKHEPLFECTELCKTEDMAQRKQIMEENTDAFVIAPGGIGTMDEFFQAWTLKDLGWLDDKPIVVFNYNGFYDSLKVFLNDLSQRGFLRSDALDKIAYADTPRQVMEKVAEGLELRAALKSEVPKYAEVMRQLGYEERLIDSVVPKTVTYLHQTQFHPIDPVEFVHRVVDDVYQDWITYKNTSYDEYCQAFPGTTTEEYYAENEDRLDSDFFAALNIKNLIDWEAEMDNDEQMRLMNEDQEEAQAEGTYRNGSGHPKHFDDGDVGDTYGEW